MRDLANLLLKNLTILNTYDFINNINMINLNKNKEIGALLGSFFSFIKRGFYLKKDKYFFPFACVKITEGKIACAHAQAHRTLRCMDGSPPGSSVHGIFPGKNTGVGCHFLFQEIFLTQGSNPHLLCLLHCTQTLNH